MNDVHDDILNGLDCWERMSKPLYYTWINRGGVMIFPNEYFMLSSLNDSYREVLIDLGEDEVHWAIDRNWSFNREKLKEIIAK